MVRSSTTAPATSQARQVDFDWARNPPAHLFLSLSTSDICNYRCRHCHIWMQSALPDVLPIERRLQLVHEFADVNPAGTVIVPGGEVTMNLFELLAVAGACRERRLACVVMTNGSLVGDHETAESLVGSGITLMSVSLDSHLADTHNYVRGVPAAFEDATRAVRLLAKARDAGSASFTLIVTAVLFKENLTHLPELARLCRGLGADHVDFQMLARTFANAHPSRDHFFEKHFWHTPEEKATARRTVESLFEDADLADGFLVKKRSELDWILPYVEDPDFRTESPVCGSHHQNLLVDAEGNAALCFNTRRILDDPFVGNAAHHSLKELWGGAKARQDRATMDECTLNCGALNCHRKKHSRE